jgi:N-acylglucosamine 2-epimerase
MSNSLNVLYLLNEYEHHLQTTLLPFWLRAVDEEDGGYYTCYDNSGSRLVSHDKYTWSQGRFVWIFAKLASMQASTFGEMERENFLKLAAHGAEFLMKHCLLENGNCTFLMDKKGTPKLISKDEEYDSSIFADCFVVIGLAKYAAVAKAVTSLSFARKLYASIVDRIEKGTYNMEPYPTPQGYKSHNIPMIMLNVSQELLESIELLQDTDTEGLKTSMNNYMEEITMNFMDEYGVLNEMITIDNHREQSLLGRYCNPGHAIEDMWFVIHAAEKLNMPHMIGKATKATKKMIELGWDADYGGLFLFVDREGGQPKGSTIGIENTSMVQQIERNWDNKLWWPHSEALYTTLLCYKLTHDEDLLELYEMIHNYTFRTFPNPDIEVGEWIQIRDRKGEPISKVVALPVKDPFHIIRNVIYIIELLEDIQKV